MGSVLFAGAHRDQQPRVAREHGAHRVGGENAQVQRQAHVVIAGCFAILATAEWLRGDAAVWAALAGAAGLVALVLAVRPPGPRHTLSVAAGVASVLRPRRRASCRPNSARRSRRRGGSLSAARPPHRSRVKRCLTASTMPSS